MEPSLAPEVLRLFETTDKDAILQLLTFAHVHRNAPTDLEPEKDNLLGAILWADRNQAWQLVLAFAETIAEFLGQRGYWADREGALAIAIKAAQSSEDQRALARALSDLATTYWHQGKWGHAEQLYQQALTLGEQMSDQKLIGRIHANLGTLKAEAGDWDIAI